MLDLGKTLLKEDEWENVNSIFIDYIWELDEFKVIKKQFEIDFVQNYV